ncbi:MAG: NADH-quinone oxidoreductase subunit J [Opitutaceae bacterium]|nr:NADH-quinone oxidoreductase subunit J [Opitutaceae bacterium]
MSDAFFYIFATLTLASAILVVANRNAVNSAVFMIVSFLGMASLFVLLEAYFLAVIQVLVYAGAVIVLFLFIIMLLDVKGGDRQKFRPVTAIATLAAAALLFTGVGVLYQAPSLAVAPPADPGVGASLKDFGALLFTRYLLPMQVTGFLLLIAMIGVIVLSKRFDASKQGPTA